MQVLGVTAMAMGAGLRGGARMEMPIRSSFERGNSFMPHQNKHSTALKMRSRRSGLAMAGMSYEVLEERLGSGEWALADEETRRLLMVLAGDAAVKRNYVFFSEVKFIPTSDLQAIDQLWRKHSNSRFGYSVQRRIWNKVNRDFTEFFKKVGWMKLLKHGEGEQEHYSYRSFPAEFVWDLGDSTPEGHLPLTNALRGTQLLATILQHPAFTEQDQLLL